MHRKLVLLLLVISCGLMAEMAEARYYRPRFARRWHGHGVHGAHPHRFRTHEGRHAREWQPGRRQLRQRQMREAYPAQQAQRAQRTRQAQVAQDAVKTHHAEQAQGVQRTTQHASEQIVSHALHGGRDGETITDMPNSLLVRIPGYQGERFDVRLDGSMILLRSLSRYRDRGYGYTRKIRLPANAIAERVTATHLRGSGIEIRIPTVTELSPQSPQEFRQDSETQKANDKAISKNKQARRTLADRLNRKWEDPEGVLLEEDYNAAVDGYSDGGSLQIIDMESSVSYIKDENAVSGYIDVRGAWQSY